MNSEPERLAPSEKREKRHTSRGKQRKENLFREEFESNPPSPQKITIVATNVERTSMK
jgi:hypothetical protein